MTDKIETLKVAMLELNEYKTMHDVDGIEELFENENSRNEFLSYLWTLKKDSIVAKNAAREQALNKIIGIIEYNN